MSNIPQHLLALAGASTTSLANRAVEPGVENMLGHAPSPLAETGLDMRGGHPAG